MSQVLINKAFEIKNLPLELDELIQISIENDTICNSIIILPTGKQVRYRMQKIIRSYYNIHKKPISNLELYTLEGYFNKLFQLIHPNKYIHKISEAYRIAIFEEAIDKSELKFFKLANKPSSHNILKKLSNVVYGLREDGITTEMLRLEIENAIRNDLKNYDLIKMTDIYEIYKYYENTLNRSLVDYPEILFRMIKDIKENNDIYKKIDEAYTDKNYIFINGFSEFKKPEIELISLLYKLSLPVGISIDYSPENGPLFGNLEETVISLERSGYVLINKMKQKYGNNISDLYSDKLSNSEFLRMNLFYSKEYRSKKTDSLNNIVLICEAEDRIDEVQSIARLVKHLLINYQISPSEICISMRQPKLYTMLFREQFQRYSIPFNISDRFLLSTSPLILSIFSMLNLIVNGFLRDDVHKVLSSKYFKICDDIDKIDTDNLYNIALKLRILGGTKRGGAELWKKRLETSIKIKEKRIIEEEKETEDILELENLKNDLRSLKKAYSDFLKLYESLTFDNKFYTPIEFYEILFEKIIEKFKIYDNLVNQYGEIEKKYEKNETERRILLENLEKDSRALVAFKECVEEFIYIIQQRYPNKQFTMSEYVAKLKITASEMKYQIHEKPGFGIDITSVEQTRGIPYKVMILCGAVDGEFPISYKPEYFLGKEVPESEVRHNKSERLQFYQFLTNSTELLDSGKQKIYIFYPKSDGSKELVPSPFINALLKITTLKENNRYIILKDLRNQNTDGENNINKQQDLKWADSISSAFELYKHFALNFINKSSEPLKEIIKELSKEKNIIENIDYIEYILSKADFYNVNNKIKIEINQEKIKDNLRNLLNKPFSITELETYAQCPFKYFLQYILKLREKEYEELGLSPLEKGVLLHKILYRFYTEQQQKNGQTINDKINLVKLESKLKNEYLQNIKVIAEEEIEQIKFEHPYFNLEADELIGTSAKRGILDIWLTNELKKIENGWDYKPFIFEWSFGIESKISSIQHQSYIELGGLKLRGKIDRIELLEEQNELFFLIADYKLSDKNLATNIDIIRGTSFQVPLYILVSKNILKTHYNIEAKPIGGVYYILIQNYDRKTRKYNSYQFVLIPKDCSLSKFCNPRSNNQTIDSIEEMGSYLENSLNTANRIRLNISEGLFSIRPQKEACEHCSFNSICRKKKE